MSTSFHNLDSPLRTNFSRIIIVANLALLQKFHQISDNRIKFLTYLSEHPDITLMDSTDFLDPNHPIVPPNILIHYILGPGAGSMKSQLVVPPEQLNTPKFKLSPSTLTCLWFEDVQHINFVNNIIPKFDAVLLNIHNKQLIKTYRKQFPTKIISGFGHFIDPTTFTTPSSTKSQNKIYDIIFYGRIDHHYPFRQRLHDLIKDNYKKYEWKVKFINHPGYHPHQYKNKPKIVGQELSRYLNQSYLTVATPSSYDFLVKKYLEAPLASCGILGNIPTGYEPIFKNRIIQVTPAMSDKQILKIIHQSLLHKNERILPQIKSLKPIITKNFTYPSGLLQFLQILKKMWWWHHQLLNRKNPPSPPP